MSKDGIIEYKTPFHVGCDNEEAGDLKKRADLMLEIRDLIHNVYGDILKGKISKFTVIELEEIKKDLLRQQSIKGGRYD